MVLCSYSGTLVRTFSLSTPCNLMWWLLDLFLAACKLGLLGLLVSFNSLQTSCLVAARVIVNVLCEVLFPTAR